MADLKEIRVVVPTLLYVSVHAASDAEAKKAAIDLLKTEMQIEDGVRLNGIVESTIADPVLYLKWDKNGNIPLRGITIEDRSTIDPDA